MSARSGCRVDTGRSTREEAKASYGTGTMVNIHGTPGDERDRARAWTPEVNAHLQQAQSTYDPHNLLRYGHTVPPA